MPYRRGIYVTQDSLDNWDMAKCHTKPKHRGILRIVKPEIVLRELNKMGVEISHRTLQRYAEDGLIPKPETKAAGRGKGKITDYPDETPGEAFASWLLMKGNLRRRKEEVKMIREAALGLREYPNDPLSLYYLNTWKAWSKEPKGKTYKRSDFDDETLKIFDESIKRSK